MEVKAIELHRCLPANAKIFMEWLTTRGGLALWRSINLSNPGLAWTTPATEADGTPKTKPSRQAANEPYRIITDPDEVVVDIPKEVKRFRIGIRKASQGMSLKVTDGDTRRIRKEVVKAQEQYGEAWYEFDYILQEVIILVPEKTILLRKFLEEQMPTPQGHD